MTSFYDEIEIEDMDFDEEKQTYYYPCPYVVHVDEKAFRYRA
jgi:hypothetical protein